MSETEPLQAGEREQRSADRARLGLVQPRLDIAAQKHRHEVGPKPHRLGLTAQRGGTERRPVRQTLDRSARAEISASRTSSRGRVRGDNDAVGMIEGKSLAECAAASIAPARSAASISW
jgi:hypothetical protein